MSWQTGKKVKPVFEFTEETWRQGALCAQIDVGDAFFPDTQGENSKEAKSICNACEVKEPCLQYALRRSEWGIWGGTTARERQIMRRSLGIRLTPEPIRDHGTEAGARAHYRRREPLCDPCRRAANLAARQRA